MKISIAASILILLVAALFGVPSYQRLVDVRASHAKLVATAAQLGMAMDSSRPDSPIRSTKRQRENKIADAKCFAAELIAYAKELEAMGENADRSGEIQQKRYLEIIDRMMALDAEQLKTLIKEFHAAKDLKGESRQGLIGLAASTLGNDHPQAFLALLAESKDLFEEYDNSTYVVSSSLTQWAKNDPLAAVEWVKKNAAKFPNLVTDDAKCGLINMTSIKDPKLAFKLLGELGIKETSQIVSNLMGAAKTPEEQTATLTALREHLTTIQDEKARNELSNAAMNRLAERLGREGFDAGTRWIAKSNFNPEEIENFTEGIYEIKNGEHGQWIDWIGEKLPATKANEAIKKLFGNWTREDHQAAGKWLATAAAGPTKNSAIRSYAETVSQYEPAVAAQWAMTLPAGEDRDQTLKRIYRNWPESDPAAKQAFKLEHGIK